MKKKNIFLMISLLIALKFVLITSNITPYFRMMRFDELLYIDQTYNLFNGNFLGVYNEYTLTKGYIFPLFVLFFNVFKISYVMGLEIFYVITLLLFFRALRYYTDKEIVKISIFAVLLFSPVIVTWEMSNMFYRNGLSLVLAFLLFVIFLEIYNNSNNQKNYFLFGIVAALFMLNREDFYWFIPIFISLLFIKTKITNKIVPIVIIACSFFIVATVNYYYYDTFIVNELKSGQFKNTYSLMMSVKRKNDSNLIFSERIELVKEYSPAFNSIFKDDNFGTYMSLKGNVESYKDLEDRGIPNHFFWIFRERVQQLGYYESANEAELFYKRIYDEIKKEIDDGNLTKEKTISTGMALPIYLDQINLEYLGAVSGRLATSFKMSATYDGIKYVEPCSPKYFGYEKKFEKITNVENKKFLCSEKTRNYNQTTIVKIERIRKVYAIVTPFLLLGGFGSLIALIYKKKDIFAELAIFLAVTLLALGVSFADYTSFYALRFYYLAPLYFFLPIASILLILKLIKFYDPESIRKLYAERKGKNLEIEVEEEITSKAR